MYRVEHIMGMPISIDGRDDGVDDAALDAAFSWLRWVDGTFSTYKEDSEISRLARGDLSLEDCDAEVRAVLALADAARRDTDGFFDVRADSAGRLDPSGIVKGWSVERASEILASRGWTNHCINAGGDVRLRGRPQPGRLWQVGIVHPFDHRALTTVVMGADLAVATSGISERGLHVFDPHTGQPASDLASVTLVGPELVRTDVFATAALAMGLACVGWLAALPDHEAYVIDRGGHAWWTAGFARFAPRLIEDSKGERHRAGELRSL